MRTWVVTGPIGSGKSAVTRYLAEHGAVILDGDRLGYEILDRREVIERIVARFGDDVVDGGAIDRSRLGALVFADAAALEDLNGITHGPLAALFAERLAELARTGRHELAVLEAAVYFLLPEPPPVDLVVAVVADPGIRQQRLIRQRSLTPEAARRRIAAQAHWEPLWAGADVIIANDGTPEQLRQAAAELRRRHLETDG